MTTLRTAKRFVFPLLGLWILLYASFSLVKPPLLDGPDALNAEIAREMLVGGHWVTPYANGIPWAQHPPLLYWTVACSFGLFGVSDWAARLPLALATLALFITTFSLGRRLFRSPTAAFYSTLALLTSYGVFLLGHLLLRDVFLCLWTTLALNFFWRSLSQQKHLLGTSLGFGAACALGVLSEGLAGVLFPVAIAVLYLAFTGQTRHLLRWQAIPSILTFLAIVLPWHIASRIASGGMRFEVVMPRWEGGRVPLFIFWPLLLLWIVPWSVFSLRALKIGDSPNPERRRQARLFCLIWIFVVLIFFSFTARQEFNVLTALPPMALLAGGWLAEDESLPHHQGRISTAIVFFFGLAAAGLVAYILVVSPTPAPGVDIATLLRGTPGVHAVFFGYLFEITRTALGAFKVPLAITLAALLAGVSGGLAFRLRDNARWANCFLAGMIVAILIAAQIALNTFSPVLSSEILAEAIKPEVQSTDIVVVNGAFESASSVAFYLDRSVLILKQPGILPAGMTASSSTPQVLIGTDKLSSLWSGSARVWLWTTPATLPVLPGPTYVIGRSGGKEMVSNQPNTGGASF